MHLAVGELRREQHVEHVARRRRRGARLVRVRGRGRGRVRVSVRVRVRAMDEPKKSSPG